ncbi:MAG TPA: glycosyltransferase family 39 protein [Thermomicrobiales bacterium]|nr:glycosyltransferase family 39 protein [Thermomicrobiales bacterium]
MNRANRWHNPHVMTSASAPGARASGAFGGWRESTGGRGSRLMDWAFGRVDALTMAILFVAFLLLRLPFRSTYPVNWDSVQFVLGIQDYDIVHHRPHPPGYIGYIGLAKVLNFFTGDPHAALIIISLVSGAVVPAGFYMLARRFMPQIPALCAAVAFGTSMLITYYSEVALTYIAELALLVPVLYFLHRGMMQRAPADLLIASGLLAAVGSIRQTALALMLPLWLYALWRVGWRDRIRAGAVLTAGVLIWLVPLLWLAGGPLTYIQASRDLAELTGGHTSILALKPFGVLQNLAFVSAGFFFGVNVAALVIIRAWPQLRSRWRASSRQTRMFFLLWAAPALAVYVLGHTGQIGYILVLLPIPFLAFGLGLARASQFLRARAPQLSMRAAPVALTAIIVAVNVTGFLTVPAITNNALHDSVAMDLRQFDLPDNDRHWQRLESTIRNYPADATVVLTTIGGPRVSGSFRHLTYLLPEYRVYGLGRDLNNGYFGPLFSAYEGESDYAIPGMRTAATRLELPPNTRYLVIPDAEIASRIEVALGDRPNWIDRRGNATVVVIDPETVIAFAIEGEIISLVQCQGAGCTADEPDESAGSR